MNKKEIINKLKNNNKNIKYADFCSILKNILDLYAKDKEEATDYIRGLELKNY